MSAHAEAHVAPVAAARVHTDEQLAPLWLRVLTFFIVTATAALSYARLLHDPPAGVAVAVAAVASACGAGLSLAPAVLRGAPRSGRGRLRGRPARAAVIVLAALGGLGLGLLVVGVPARLIAPWHWKALANAVGGGLTQLGGWSWPYLGSSHWARLSVLMLLVPATTLMALLYFWPAREGAAARRLGALAIAVGLAVSGMTNVPNGGWRVQGLLLVVLVFAWLWLPTVRRLDAGRALAWAGGCAMAALVVAPALGASHAWIPLGTSESSHTPVFGSVRPVAGDFTGTQALLYGPITLPRSQQPMVVVQSSGPPGLLRVTSLDRFDGLRFLRTDAPPQTVSSDVPAGADANWYQSATVTVGALRSNMLVGTSGITTHITWHGRRAPTVGEAPDGTLSLSSPPASGTRYTVLSYAPKPTAEQMRAAPQALPSSYLPYTEFELPLASASARQAPQLAREAASPPRRGQLVRPPQLGSGTSTVARRILASPYGPMYALARRLAVGAGTSYEVTDRIERYLLAGYTYDEQPPLARYPLEAFLFESRRGYCEQFAGAMALMLRMDGIPARVSVGFRPELLRPPSSTGAQLPGGSAWTARPQDAHAWVEVFFNGIGWVPFDPTPATSQGGGGGGGAAFAAMLLATISPGATRAHGSPATGPAAGTPAGSGARDRAGASGPAAWEWGLLALALSSGLAVWVYVRAARVRARVGDIDGVEAAVRELERALRGSAWPLAPGTTLTQVAQSLERLGQPHAADYVWRLCQRRFGRAPAPGAQEGADARFERLALRRALAHGKGLRGRLRAFCLLPPRAPGLWSPGSGAGGG